MTQPNPLVDIIIPIYGATHFLQKCVAAVLKNTYEDFRLILVDDCSPDNSWAREFLGMVNQLSSDAYRDRVLILYNDMNLGFGATCNRGVAAGIAPFVCVLNSDTEPQPMWMSHLLANFANDKVGMVGPKLVFPPKHDSRITHVGGRIQSAGNYFRADKLPAEAFRNYQFDNWAVNRRMYVSNITHACVVVRRSLWGEGYDPRYKVGAFEDVDMCLRLTSGGWKIVYEPDAVVWHVQGASYDHHESDNNLRLLMERWGDTIVPDPDIFSDNRERLPKPAYWWLEEA